MNHCLRQMCCFLVTTGFSETSLVFADTLENLKLYGDESPFLLTHVRLGFKQYEHHNAFLLDLDITISIKCVV